MDMVVLAFLDLASLGLPSIGTYWGTCSEEASPLSVAAVLSGEETISLTCWGSCSEGSVGLGVLWVRGKVFLDDLVERDREGSGEDVLVGSGEAEEDSKRRVLVL